MEADQLGTEGSSKEVAHMNVALEIMCPIWACFDEDGSGTITIPEAMDVARGLKAEMLAGKLFDEMDLNQDGQIAFKEFFIGFQALGSEKYKDLTDDGDDPEGRTGKLGMAGNIGII